MLEETTLATFYRGWEAYQGLLATVIAPLSPEQLALRAAPALRSIGVIAAHIIAARVWWFHFILGEGSADLAPLVRWDDDDAPPRTAAELVGGLETTWNLVQDALQRWTSDDLAQSVRRQVRGQEREHMRGWVVWHLIEHDLHHGGELSLTLGMHGLTAPDL
ncbi:MAG: DinB family protein [Ardenticatenaceae bacterium]|nr:DinB family protein [Ardenticatenaceae bacterium]